MNMNEEDSASYEVGEGLEMEVDVDPLMRTLTRKVVMWTLYIVDTADMVNTVYIVYSVVSCIMKGCSNFFNTLAQEWNESLGDQPQHRDDWDLHRPKSDQNRSDLETDAYQHKIVRILEQMYVYVY